VPGGGGLGRDAVGRVGVEVDDRDREPVGGEPKGDRPTDAGPSAGDRGGTAGTTALRR
jgi:hypothetical protein